MFCLHFIALFLHFLELTFDKMPQCQFLFSAVFGFRNPTQEIFSELDNSKTEVPIFTVPKQLTWRESKKGCREATSGLGAA